MPKAKKTTLRSAAARKTVRRTSSRSLKSTPEVFESRENESQNNMSTSNMNNNGLKLVLGLVILVLIVGSLVYIKRGSIMAARINNSFISRWDLDRRLETQYGQPVVEQMISEQLIFDEGAKKQIKVSQSEVDAKITQITSQLGGQVNINDLLAQQGMTMADLRKQVEVQLLVDKLTVGLVNVSDQEITDYIDKNRSSMTATDEGTLKKEALDTLAAQKKSEAVQKWFSDLKSKARIVKYF